MATETKSKTRRSKGKAKNDAWPVGEVLGRLGPLYGPAERPRGYDPTSELVYTILSQHTSDTNSTRAYANLREAFDDWDAVVEAEDGKVAAAIKTGGLAQTKAPRIQAILREVKARVGGYDLSFLAELPLAEAKDWLRDLPGVGPKTVGCVLMFALDMPALPVDTHVYRVAQRLGYYDGKVNAEQSHDVLEEMIPPAERLPFHVYLIRHGREVCKAQHPLCSDCVLEERCPSSLLKPGSPLLKKPKAKRRARGR